MKPCVFGGWKWGVKLRGQDSSEALWGTKFDEIEDALAEEAETRPMLASTASTIGVS